MEYFDFNNHSNDFYKFYYTNERKFMPIVFQHCTYCKDGDLKESNGWTKRLYCPMCGRNL